MLEVKVKLRKWRVGHVHPERETKIERQRGLGGEGGCQNEAERKKAGRDGFKEGETERTEREKKI